MPDVLGGLLARRGQFYAGMPLTQAVTAAQARLPSLEDVLLAPARAMSAQPPPAALPGLLGRIHAAIDPMQGGYGNMLAMALPPGAKSGGLLTGGGAAEQAVETAIGKSKPGGLLGTSTAKKTAGLPDLRDMPIEDAIAIAREEPHLVPKKGGGFEGGPPGVKTKADLLKLRRKYDKMIADDPRGGDWYERYRAGTTLMTGGDPQASRFASQRQGMFSQGVSPESEIQYGLKEANASIAGMPERAMYGTQHARHMAAVEENNPLLYTSGNPKVGEYAAKIDPTVNLRTATGTNDFRSGKNWGFRMGSGTTKKQLTTAQHRFVDFETALAVDRARQRELGGIKDWTGESAQAAPWVVQKAHAIVAKRNLVAKNMRDGLGRRAATKAAYEQGFAEANKVPADFFPKHTAFMTHEEQPGATVGHLPGSVEATQAERTAYGTDPLSRSDLAPGNRDFIYGGLSVPGTGNAMSVLPSNPMTGVYQGKSGLLETNPGTVGRPLASFKTTPKMGKKIPKAERAIFQAGETLRAALSAQESSAGHMVFPNQPAKTMRSAFMPLKRKLEPEELLKVRDVARQHGLLDVVDTGQGVTITNFGPKKGPPIKANSGLLGDIEAAVPQAAHAGRSPFRVKVDSIYADLSDKWHANQGEAAVSKEVLSKLNVTPEMRASFDANPHLAEAALNRVARDKTWMEKWGVVRRDVQNFRKIVASGPGWIARLEKAVREAPGTVPILFVGVLTALADRERKKQ